MQNGADGPQRVPRLRVEVGHGQAQLGVGLEAPVGCDHVDGRWAVRIVAREDQLAVVEAGVVGRVGRAVDDIVPLEDVGLAGLSRYVSNGILTTHTQPHSRQSADGTVRGCSGQRHS